MRYFLLILFLLPSWSFAAETINCYFDKFHQVNHEAPEMTGYAAIDQSLEIIAGKTSEKTLKLDGKDRAANSTYWVVLKPKGWAKFTTTYIGDFGELLTIEHELNDSSQVHNGWYKASLVSSRVITTHTSLGRCLIK